MDLSKKGSSLTFGYGQKLLSPSWYKSRVSLHRGNGILPVTYPCKKITTFIKALKSGQCHLTPMCKAFNASLKRSMVNIV